MQPDLVVNLGDTFDTHAVVRSEIMNEYVDHVKYICAQGIPYHYLLGNHDMYKPNDAKYHALKPFKNTIQGFTVIDETIDLDGITYVPFQAKHTTFPKVTQSICVAHQTFKGADFGDITTQDGVDPLEVDAEIIISGHIHKKQTLGNVIYPGSPFSQSVNDINQVKGLMLFDTATFATTFIPCPLPKWKGLKFELTPSYDINALHEEVSQELNDSDHWVVEITGPRAEIVGYLDSKRSKALIQGKDVKIKTHFTDKEKRAIRIEAFSMEHIISEYASKIYSGTIDKDILRDKALEILSSTRTQL